MPRPRPPFLHRQTTRHGKTVWYVRKGRGQRIRLRATFGTPEFSAEYQAAMEGNIPAAPTKPGASSLAWLVGRYRESSAWAVLSPATKRQRENILRGALSQIGDMAFTAVTRAKIIEGRESRHATPAQANVYLKVMRGMFEWAVEMEHVKVNPARDVKSIAHASEGFHTWTEEELARFEAKWPLGTRERLAFDVLLYTGLRRGDAVRLGRQHVREGVFSIDTEKTGTRVVAPILPPLTRSIEAAPTGDLAFIVGARGRPMAKEAFTNWFRGVCADAGVPGSAHGLRKAGATRAAMNGATVVQLRAMFGWTSDKMPAHYTRAADRILAAAGGMAKLERKTKT